MAAAAEGRRGAGRSNRRSIKRWEKGGGDKKRVFLLMFELCDVMCQLVTPANIPK